MPTKTLPLLYKRGANGNLFVFRVEIIDAQVLKYSYQLKDENETNKKPDEVKPSISEYEDAKVGQKTGKDRALIAANNEWKKKKDRGYEETIPSPSKTCNNNSQGNGDDKKIFKTPMLAKTYPKDAKLPKRGCAQKKINGNRGFALVENDGIHIYSRTQNEYPQFPHINKVLLKFYEKVVEIMPEATGLDGELYIYGQPFQIIESVCGKGRKTKEGKKYAIHPWAPSMKFYLFDIVDNGENIFEDRIRAAATVFSSPLVPTPSAGTGVGENWDPLVFVGVDLFNTEDELVSHHIRYVLEGYEGTIIRDLDSVYRGNGYRSSGLLKYKDVQDEEAEIIGGKPVTKKGTREGCIVFRVRNDRGIEYDCTPACSVAESREMYKNLQKYIGRIVKVEYQESHESGVVQFGRALIEKRAKIIGGKGRKGKRYEGCIVFDIVTEDGEKIQMIPGGSIEEWREMLENLDDYIGQDCVVSSKSAGGSGEIKTGRLLSQEGSGRVLGRRDRE